jgi:hypothetical protein
VVEVIVWLSNCTGPPGKIKVRPVPREDKTRGVPEESQTLSICLSRVVAAIPIAFEGLRNESTLRLLIDFVSPLFGIFLDLPNRFRGKSKPYEWVN